MARTGRPKSELVLLDEESETLKRYARRPKSSQRLALRSRIVLECSKGLSNSDVAEKLGVAPHTVGKWRARFVSDRLDGLGDAARPGAPRQIGDDVIEDLVVKTLETMPKGASRWSTRDMAEQAGVSPSTVSRIWRAFGLKPHRSETFQLSSDPDFIEKVRDVVGLYLTPPANAVVLSVDEKSQIQALDRTQPLLPMGPGDVEKRTPEYVRHGTTSLFAALDVATGSVIGKCFRRHRSTEFLAFLRLIDKSVEPDLDVHIILDNLATHKTQAVLRWLVRRPRFHLHFIPTHSSWLNLVETFFSILTEKQLKRGVHRSVRAVEAAVYEHLEVVNDHPKPFKWTKTADEILKSVARLCERTLKRHTR
jgi:transposase